MKESAQEVLSGTHQGDASLTLRDGWGRILAVHTTRGKSQVRRCRVTFLAVSPVTCRLHSKGPRVLNFHSNGACSLGWTTYITIVSALAAASDHGFSCHLEAAAWLPMVPTVPASACMSLGMMGGSIYYEAGSVPQPCPT